MRDFDSGKTGMSPFSLHRAINSDILIIAVCHIFSFRCHIHLRNVILQTVCALRVFPSTHHLLCKCVASVLIFTFSWCLTGQIWTMWRTMLNILSQSFSSVVVIQDFNKQAYMREITTVFLWLTGRVACGALCQHLVEIILFAGSRRNSFRSEPDSSETRAGSHPGFTVRKTQTIILHLTSKSRPVFWLDSVWVTALTLFDCPGLSQHLLH